MNFAEWLDLQEARWGHTPGAFGKSRVYSSDATATHSRASNQFQSYGARVAFGKSIEDKIIQGLGGCGLKIRKPTEGQDRFSKIDGWWNDGTGEKPVQIKYRDTGDDILFEVLSDAKRRSPGRDMVGKAEYYIVLSRDGKLARMVSTAEAKSLIRTMQQTAETQGFDDRGDFRMRVPGGTAMLRFREDPATGVRKLMAYLPPTALKSVQTCPMTVSF